MKKKALFLDDFRMPLDVLHYTKDESLHVLYIEENWDIVRNYEEFKNHIKNKGIPDLISFDHDLAHEHYSPLMYANARAYNALYKTFNEKTGYHAAKWLKSYLKRKGLEMPEIYCHSQNPIGKKNILKIFNCI